MLAVYNLFGVSELTARLPSAIAGIGTVVLTYHLSRMLFDRRSGLIASCLLSCALYFAVMARWATPDSLLILCITASLTSFVAGVAAWRGGSFSGSAADQTGNITPITDLQLPAITYVGMYVAMGLAVLAKGPIGIVMPLAIVGSYLLIFDGAKPMSAGTGLQQFLAPYFTSGWRQRWVAMFQTFLGPRNVLRVLRSLRLGIGIPIVALVALPWYIAVAVKTDGQWVAGFIGNHNVGRFLQPMEHHNGWPLYYAYYLVAIMAGFFPGSVFLPLVIWSAAKNALGLTAGPGPSAVVNKYDPARRQTAARRASSAFALCWIACYVGFFTLAATKLVNYVTPCYPALAALTGAWLSAVALRATARDWRLLAGYASLGISGLAGALALGIAAHQLLKIDPLLALPGIVALVGGMICIALLIGNRRQASLVNFVGTCLLVTATAMTCTAARISPLQEGPLLAQRIKALSAADGQHEPRVATYHYLTPTLVYYLHHPVERIETADEMVKFFDRGDVLIMPRDVYQREREHLPSDVRVLGEEQRFLRKNNFVVMVGRSTDVARGDSGDVHAH
jgi:4-amino-4-deoxy-L-arabinose transferase-like glycosyltransferase